MYFKCSTFHKFWNFHCCFLKASWQKDSAFPKFVEHQAFLTEGQKSHIFKIITSLTSLTSVPWLRSMRTTVLCPCIQAQWIGRNCLSSARLGSALARQNRAHSRASPVIDTICNTVCPIWKMYHKGVIHKIGKYLYYLLKVFQYIPGLTEGNIFWGGQR